MRTILGIKSDLDSRKVHYLEGDDISENAFLLSNGKPLRFGHKNLKFIEYGPAVTKAIDVAALAVASYTGSTKTTHIPKLFSVSLPQNVISNLSEKGEFGTRYCPVKRE